MLNRRIWGRVAERAGRYTRSPLKQAVRDAELVVQWTRLTTGRLPEVERPIIVTGTARSNTTFFTRMLGQHPELCRLEGERIDDWAITSGSPIAAPSSGSEFCPHASAAAADATRALRKRMAFLHSVGGGGRWLLNHNPHLAYKIPLVYGAFPDARIVVTSRGLVDTVASLKGLWSELHRGSGAHHYLPKESDDCWSCRNGPHVVPEHWEQSRTFPGGDVEVLAEYWLRTYQVLARDLRGDAVHVRYDEFVADPELQLRRCARALGLAEHRLGVAIDRERARARSDALDAGERDKLAAFRDRHATEIDSIRFAGRGLSDDLSLQD